ncbi:MAG TPA: DUF1634 domain-containing protein [Acidimicrobiales bacterium]|nr:DUF1634 domain-containing protein [Acidimicrobiales bacterium]
MTVRSDEQVPRHDQEAPEDVRVRRVELAISLVLRIGVTTSIAITAAGLALMFVHHPAYGHLSGSFSYHRLTSTSTPFPHTFSQLGAALDAGEGRGLVVVGILVLILTPVLRVAVSVISFLYERDRAMSLVTLFVLAALVGSFFLGGVLS